MALKPVIYLAFANDLTTKSRNLQSLEPERQSITQALEPITHPDASWQLKISWDATPTKLVEPFYRDDVTIFHYAGHANPESILLETDEGGNKLASAVRLVDFIARQKSLKLVFLNACETGDWAASLLQLGVPCVIATTREVNDATAAQFAKAFYECLANDLPIPDAYEEAKAGLDFTNDGHHRYIASLHTHSPESTGFPWQLHTATAEAAQARLSVFSNDPLIGLPPLSAELQAPDTPCVDLAGHTRPHAPIFFGRNHEIRALYDWVLNSPAEPPILLLHGITGVGKSSLLNAGLLPRLDGKAERFNLQWGANLAASLSEALASANEFPKLLVIDQLEQAFTHAESEKLPALLNQLNPSPTSRVILCVRTQYLSDVKAAVTNTHQPFSEFQLAPFDSNAIVQVITGPTRSQALRDKYKIRFADQDLPANIARHLSASDSPIAPILRMAVNQLWNSAAPNAAGERIYTKELYDPLAAARDYIQRQLKQLHHATGGTRNDFGLELDLLYEHTTGFGTSTRRTLATLKQLYPNIPNLEALIHRNQELHLLSEPAGDSDATATCLTHDILATVIRREFELSALPGPRARRTLESRVRGWMQGKKGEYLDAADLRMVRAGQDHMLQRTPDEQRMFAASRSHLRNTRIFTAIALCIVAYFATVFWWKQNRVALSTRLAAKALAPGFQPELAALLSAEAIKAADTFEARQAVLSLWVARPEKPPQSIAAADTPVRRILYSHGGKWLATATADGAVRLWNAETLALEAEIFKPAKPDPDSRPAPLTQGADIGLTAAMAFGESDKFLSVIPANGHDLWSWSIDAHVLKVALSDIYPDGRDAKQDNTLLFRVMETPAWTDRGKVHLPKFAEFAGLEFPLNVNGAALKDITGIAAQTGGTRLVTVSGGKRTQKVHVWIVEWMQKDDSQPRTLECPASEIHTTQFSRDGAWLALGGGKGLSLCNARNVVSWNSSVEISMLPVHALSFHRDNRQLAISLIDGSVNLVDLDAQEVVASLQPGFDPNGLGNVGVAFSRDGKHLAYGSPTGSVVVAEAHNLDSLTQDWPARACAIAGRNLTKREWRRYFGFLEPYRTTCPQFPAGE